MKILAVPVFYYAFGSPSKDSRGKFLSVFRYTLALSIYTAVYEMNHTRQFFYVCLLCQIEGQLQRLEPVYQLALCFLAERIPFFHTTVFYQKDFITCAEQ